MHDATTKFAHAIIDNAPWGGSSGCELGSLILNEVLDWDWKDLTHAEAFAEAVKSPHYAPWLVSVAQGYTYGGSSMLADLIEADDRGEAVSIASIMQEAFAQYMTAVVETELGKAARLVVID